MSSNENSNDRPITVGVIDDDPMICQAMRLILEDYSAGRLNVVFTCTDGSQAIDETTGHHPDVALMDIAMPGMDGIETTRRLRALPRPPHVLILTSLSPSGTVERAIEAGAEGFVSKTDAPEEIIRRITDVCVGLPQFNPASQRQLINDLNTQQPQSRRDEARAMLDALPRTGARGGGSCRRRVHQCRNRETYVHFGTHRQGAHLIRGRQIMHGPGTDGAFG